MCVHIPCSLVTANKLKAEENFGRPPSFLHSTKILPQVYFTGSTISEPQCKRRQCRFRLSHVRVSVIMALPIAENYKVGRWGGILMLQGMTIWPSAVKPLSILVVFVKFSTC